jgi:hypothetical protein
MHAYRVQVAAGLSHQQLSHHLLLRLLPLLLIM